jgi:uncharacterized peroxidase-related enzyme
MAIIAQIGTVMVHLLSECLQTLGKLSNSDFICRRHASKACRPAWVNRTMVHAVRLANSSMILLWPASSGWDACEDRWPATALSGQTSRHRAVPGHSEAYHGPISQHGGAMAWIRVIPEEQADEALQTVYQKVKGNRGKVSNILAVHSLHPKALQAHMDLYMSIMFGPSELTRPEREMIAIVVSSADRCAYCIEHHAAALAQYWQDDAKLARFVEDYRSIKLTTTMRSVLDYAHKLTTQPDAVTEEDVRHLREQGLSDKDILVANLIVSYFNFVNRVALGLGVLFTEDEAQGYKY